MLASIPQWFSRNLVNLLGKYGNFETFPYHYGSYATKRYRDIKELRGEFPYHYGSYATRANGSKTARPMRFHITIVLTQLQYALRANGSVREVSIPLWFLRN